METGFGQELTKINCGFRPPAQAPPQRDFYPGGRALWLGENADCGILKNKREEKPAVGPSSLFDPDGWLGSNIDVMIIKE